MVIQPPSVLPMTCIRCLPAPIVNHKGQLVSIMMLHFLATPMVVYSFTNPLRLDIPSFFSAYLVPRSFSTLSRHGQTGRQTSLIYQRHCYCSVSSFMHCPLIAPLIYSRVLRERIMDAFSPYTIENHLSPLHSRSQ